METNLWTRRTFLRTGGALAAGLALPGWVMGKTVRRRCEPGASLVVCCLAGGNDGLNTVIPYRSKEYYRLRPSLAIQAGQELKLNEEVGLHPALGSLKQLFDQGLVVVVQGVGYPWQHRSHFRSMRVWQSGHVDGLQNSGWMGRHLQSIKHMPGGEPHAWSVESEPPLALTPCPEVGQATRMGKPKQPFRDDPFGRAFSAAADVVEASPSGVLAHLSVGGFDTHTRQAGPHGTLIQQLGDALCAFQQALTASGRADRTLTLVYSEFGRSFHENASQGTDHGRSGPVFLVGKRARGSVLGRAPDLSEPGDGPGGFTIDFRRVYATLLDQWLGGDSPVVLGGPFEPLPLLRA